MKAFAGAALLLPAIAWAHVGYRDVVHEGSAGPYRLLVSVTAPDVIPGVARVEVEAEGDVPEALDVVAMPLSGDGARFPPTPDAARPVAGVPGRYAASLWLMSAGAWQVRLDARGAKGQGELAVPVPALPARTKAMQWALGAPLLALLLFLALGAVSIAAAGSSEAQLEPGQALSPAHRRRAWIVRAAAAALIVLGLFGANAWWNAEAGDYGRYVYKPLQMGARVADGVLRLDLRDPGWIRSRRMDDLIEDHGHLMHLYVLRVPELDRVWHLHPDPVAAAVFEHALPPELPVGRYELFADIVHATGLAETAVAELDLPAAPGAPLGPDDAAGAGPPLSERDPARREAALAGGGRMIWEAEASPLVAGRTEWLRFRVDGADGRPATSLEPYMGMAGHAAIVRDDRSLFAHIHPTGSVPMASLAVAGVGAAHAGHHAGDDPLPPEVGFPFRFPAPGPYRVIVQVKRGGAVETALFDADVGPAP